MKKNKSNNTITNKKSCNSNTSDCKKNSKASSVGFNNVKDSRSFKLDENENHSFELRDDE